MLRADVPMRMLRLGGNFWVSAGEIVLVQGFPSRPSRREKARAEAAGCFYEALLSTSKRGRTRSLVTLRNGWVIGSASRPETLARRLLQIEGMAPPSDAAPCAFELDEGRMEPPLKAPIETTEEVSLRRDTSDATMDNSAATSTATSTPHRSRLPFFRR